MASGINSLRRRVATKMVFPDLTSLLSLTLSTWNQGDFLDWDTTNNCVIRTGATGDGTHFLGIAANSVSLGKIVGPYPGLTDVVEGTGSVQGPEYGDVHTVKGKSGDTFTDGCLVYPSQGAGQTREVTSTAGALKAIGLYQGATVTAGASTEVECLIGARHPNDTLKF